MTELGQERQAVPGVQSQPGLQGDLQESTEYTVKPFVEKCNLVNKPTNKQKQTNKKSLIAPTQNYPVVNFARIFSAFRFLGTGLTINIRVSGIPDAAQNGL